MTETWVVLSPDWHAVGVHRTGNGAFRQGCARCDHLREARRLGLAFLGAGHVTARRENGARVGPSTQRDAETFDEDMLPGERTLRQELRGEGLENVEGSDQAVAASRVGNGEHFDTAVRRCDGRDLADSKHREVRFAKMAAIRHHVGLNAIGDGSAVKTVDAASGYLSKRASQVSITDQTARLADGLSVFHDQGRPDTRSRPTGPRGTAEST